MAKERTPWSPSKAISIEEFLKFIEETPRSSLKQSNPTYLKCLKRILSTKNSLEEFKNLKENVLVFILYNACSGIEEIRNIAFEIFDMLVPLLEEQRQIFCNSLDDEALNDISKDMILLCRDGECQSVFKLWSSIIKALDKALHKNRNMINKLLVVLEKTFKIQTAIAQAASYNTWKVLIDNFAIDKDLLVQAKRMKLLMQPLMSTKIVLEEANLARFNTWWHLVFRLEEKLQSEFSTVCLPLLSKIFTLPSSSARVNLNSSTSSNTSTGDMPSRKNVLLKGCEIVIRLLELPVEGAVSPKRIHQLSIPALKEPVSNQLFINHSDELLKYAKTALQVYTENQQNISAQNLLHLLLQRMMSVYKEEPTGAIEKVANFLYFFQNILKENKIGYIYSLKLLDEISRSLPTSVLASHSLRSPLNEAVHVVPAYEFLKILTNQKMFQEVSQNNLYLPVFSKLVCAGAEDKISFLKFLDSAFMLLEDLLPEEGIAPLCHSDMLSKMWYSTTSVLHKKVEETQDINMGDSLEHNFSSLLSALIFPFKLLLRQPVDEISPSLKDQKMWENICRALFRFSALMDTIESNCCCEELCQKWLDLLSALHSNSPSLSYWVLQSSCLKIILDCVDFQSVNMSTGAFQSWPDRIRKKDVKPLGNLHSFCFLLSRVVSSSLTLPAGNSESLKKSSKNSLTLQETCMDLIADCLDRVHNSVFILNLISHFVPMLVTLFTETKVMNASYRFTKKAEKLWESIVKILQARYVGERGQTLFDVLSPLLEVTLVNPIWGIQEKARQVWLSLFATDQSQLVFNDSFKQVLKKVSPPLVALNDISPEEPFSDIFEDFQQRKESPEVIPRTQVSPKFGSFLNKVNENIEKEPMAGTSTISMAKVSDKFKKPLNEMKDDEFVKITSGKKGKPKVLTEHQKEVMKEKSFIPAMYNDLSQSTQISSDSLLGFADKESPIPETIVISDTPDADKENSVVEPNQTSSDVEKPEFQDSMDSTTAAEQQLNVSKLVDNIITNLDENSVDFVPETNCSQDEMDNSKQVKEIMSFEVVTNSKEQKDKIENVTEEEARPVDEKASNITVNDKTDDEVKPSLPVEENPTLKKSQGDVQTLTFEVERLDVNETMEETGTSRVNKNVKKDERLVLSKKSSHESSRKRSSNSTCLGDIPTDKTRSKNKVKKDKLKELKVSVSKLNDSTLSKFPIDTVSAESSTTSDKLSTETSVDLLNQIAAPSSESVIIDIVPTREASNHLDKSEKSTHTVGEQAETTGLDMQSTIDISSDSCSSQMQIPIEQPKKRGRKRKSSLVKETPIKKDKTHSSAQEIPFQISSTEDAGTNSGLIEPITASAIDFEHENSKENKNPELIATNTDALDAQVLDKEVVSKKLSLKSPEDSVTNEKLITQPETEVIMYSSEIPDSSVVSGEGKVIENTSIDLMEKTSSKDIESDSSKLEKAVSRSSKKDKKSLSKSLATTTTPARTTRRSSMINLRSKSNESLEKKTVKGKKTQLASPIKLKISRKVSSQNNQELWGLENLSSESLPTNTSETHTNATELELDLTNTASDIMDQTIQVKDTSVVEDEVFVASTEPVQPAVSAALNYDATKPMDKLLSTDTASSGASSGDELFETAINFSNSPPSDESSILIQASSPTRSPKVSTPYPKKHKLVLGASPLSRSQRILQAAMSKTASESPGHSSSSKNLTSPKSSPIAKLSTPLAESPSAGILKLPEKRKKSNAENKKSPSPSAKQRRVSFADPLTIQHLVEAKKKGVSSSRRLQMASTDTNTDNGTEELEPEPIVIQDEESQMTADMVISEEESFLNSQEPIFPSLVDCIESIDNVISSLTTSFWSQALKEYLESKSISSVGEFSKLTPLDIKQLPIASPKITSVVSILTKHSKVCIHTASNTSQETIENSKRSEEDGMDQSNQQNEKLIDETDKLVEKYWSPDKSKEIELVQESKSDVLNSNGEMLSYIAENVTLSSKLLLEEVYKSMQNMSGIEVLEFNMCVNVEAQKLLKRKLENSLS